MVLALSIFFRILVFISCLARCFSLFYTTSLEVKHVANNKSDNKLYCLTNSFTILTLVLVFGHRGSLQSLLLLQSLQRRWQHFTEKAEGETKELALEKYELKAFKDFKDFKD